MALNWPAKAEPTQVRFFWLLTTSAPDDSVVLRRETPNPRRVFSCPGADGRVGPSLNVSIGKGSLDFWPGVLKWSAKQFSQGSQQ